MKRFAWVVLGMCCAATLGAGEVTVFTPSRPSDAPIYMNGEVVRIDRAGGTLTLRNEGGQSVLVVDRAVLADVSSLRPGSSVIVGYRVSGTRHVITDIRGTGVRLAPRDRVSVYASATSSGPQSIGTARITSVNARGRRLTVVDSNGATRVLDVRGGAVSTLGTLRTGDQVSLGVAAPLVTGTPAGTVTIIEPVPSAVGISNTTGPGPVPQLGGVQVSGINSQIPSIPPPTTSTNAAVLPPPTVVTETNPPRTPAQVATVRELASRDFDMAIAVIAIKAAELDRAWSAYRTNCSGTTLPQDNRSREWFGLLDGTIDKPKDNMCEQSFDEVSRLADALKAQLDTASDSARRADVLPGRMREVLQRYNLDI